MKKLFALTLCLILLFCAACAKKSDNTAADFTKIGEKITVQKVDDELPWVVTEDGYDEDSYALAQFNVASDEAEKINEKIHEKFADEDGERRLRLSYTIGQKGALCSVLLKSVYENHRVDYKAYSMDLSSGKPAETVAIADFYGYNETEYYSALKAAVKAEFSRQYGSFEGKTENYEETYQKATGDDYLKSAVPFVNSEGKLSAVVSLLGLDGEEHSFAVTLEE